MFPILSSYKMTFSSALIIHLFLSLLTYVALADPHKQMLHDAVESNENFLFATSELVTMAKSSDGNDIELEAFKADKNDEIFCEIESNPSSAKYLRFESVGFPQIVVPEHSLLVGTASSIPAFVLTPIGFHFYVQMLTPAYREALALIANFKYQTSVKINSTQVHLMKPDSFTCEVYFTSLDNEIVTVDGKVEAFDTDPLKVDVQLVRNSPIRNGLIDGSITREAVGIDCEIFKRAQPKLVTSSKVGEYIGQETRLDFRQWFQLPLPFIDVTIKTEMPDSATTTADSTTPVETTTSAGPPL